MKPVTTARQREEERLRRLEEERVREACAALASRLTDVGWTNVKVKYRAFFEISGDDPQGVNHSGAYADGGAGVDELLKAGAAPPPRKKPEPEPELLLTEKAPPAAPAISREADEFLHPERHAYDDSETVAGAVATADGDKVAVTAADFRPPSGPLAEDMDKAREENAAWVRGENGNGQPEHSEAAAIAAPPPLAPAAPIDQAGTEATPDGLTRIVPPNLTLAAQKAWAAQRWIALNARRLDMAKAGKDRVLPDLSKTETAELTQLDRYMNWFS